MSFSKEIKAEPGSPRSAAAGSIYRFENCEFHLVELELRVDGQLVLIEPRPLRVLGELLQHGNEVVTKEELLEAVWEGRSTVEHVLANAISKLRAGLGERGAARLQTVPRVGYRFAGSIQRIEHKLSPVRHELGRPVPGRDSFIFERALGSAEGGGVWLARHARLGHRHVFKFADDGARLTALKREYTLYRLLQKELGPRSDMAVAIDANFSHSPFFLECEYGGQDLQAWGEENGRLAAMPTAERLLLFVQIVRAVAAAHGVGVLHKDIKPANVLVAPASGGAWQVRLIDFGSGRLMDPERLAQLRLTAMGMTMTDVGGVSSSSGTPLYLAPELLAGQSPSLQSDVYALGVVLWQLMVGNFSRPLATGWQREIDDELLAEDIVLATEGDPQRRLASAGELADRLLHLDQRRQDNAKAEQARGEQQRMAALLARSQARRPWVVAAFLALALGLLVGAWQLKTTRAATAAALAARQEAEAVNAFLALDLLASPDVARGALERAPSMQDLLRKASAGLNQRFVDQPLAEAAIRFQLGRSFNRLWSIRLAVEEYEAAIKLRSAHVEPSDPTRALMRFEYAMLLCRAQAPVECRQLYEDASRDAPGARSDMGTELGVVEAGAAALSLGAQGQLDAALQAARRMVRLVEGLPGAGLDRRAEARGILGGALLALDQHAEFDLLLAELARPPFADTPFGLGTATHLRIYRAGVALQRGRLELAERLLDEVLSSLAPPAAASAWHLAYTHSELGHVHNAARRWSPAATHFAEAARTFAQALGADHQAVLISRKNQALASNMAGDHAQAEALLRELLPFFDARDPSGREMHARLELARALVGLRRFQEVEALLAYVDPPSAQAEAAVSELSWAARAYRAWALIQTGQRSEGERMAREARDGLGRVPELGQKLPELHRFFQSLR